MALSLESLLAVKLQAFSFSFLTTGQRFHLKALFMFLAQHKPGLRIGSNLDIVAFSNLTGDTVIADAACTFYASFAKKQATATAAYFKINDHATTAGGASGANMTDCQELNAASQAAVYVNPDGRAMASGISIASETTGAGGADTSTGDGPNGFIILGRA